VKTLLIHIGDPKTGTSSIQQVLMDQAYDSPNRSIDYQPWLNAFQLANSLSDADKGEDTGKLFNSVAAWLATSHSDLSVMSAEQFFCVDPVILQQALETYLPEYASTARVVAYVRPHPGRFLSHFVQLSKTGVDWSDMDARFDRMTSKNGLRYTDRFLAWRRTFGDRFTLRPMVRDVLFNRDVVADFFQTALQGAPFTLHPAASSNESPSLQVLAGLREMYAVLALKGVPVYLRKTVGQYLVNKLSAASGRKGTKLCLSTALYERIRAHCQDDAMALDDAFFSAPVMTTALADAAKDTVATAMSLAADSHYTPQSLIKLRRVSQRLATLLAKDGDLWRSSFFLDIKQRSDSTKLRHRIMEHDDQLKAIEAALARATRILTEEFLLPT
jgi:hypothetical protein